MRFDSALDQQFRSQAPDD